LDYLDQLLHAPINETLKGHLLASNRVVWAIVHVHATLGSTGARLREKDVKRKKS
jgi:hypothetical protein